MSYRQKTNYKKSKKQFSRTASKINNNNLKTPKRGGYRL